MKFIKSLSILTVSVIMLVACDDVENKVKTDYSRFQTIDSDYNYSILKDIETGCEYIYLDSGNAGGITPIYENSNKIKGCIDELD